MNIFFAFLIKFLSAFIVGLLVAAVAIFIFNVIKGMVKWLAVKKPIADFSPVEVRETIIDKKAEAKREANQRYYAKKKEEKAASKKVAKKTTKKSSK